MATRRLKIISHRGNLTGPNEKLENNPKYIKNAITSGFDVEVDLWVTDEMYLGHDDPTYMIKKDFFCDKMWIHCKNLKAVEVMKSTNLNWFWHDKDKMTLTSKGSVWAYPGVYVSGGITVECGRPFKIIENIAGVCTDYPVLWKEKQQ